MRAISPVLVTLAVFALPLGAAPVQSTGTSPDFYLLKLAETSAPVPGTPGANFTGFSTPTAGGFVGSWSGGAGAFGIHWNYSGAGTLPTRQAFKIADTNTPIPGGSGTFVAFDTPTGGGIVSPYSFRGTGALGQQGIYTSSDAPGSLTLLADKNTPIPGGSGNFTAFGPLPAATVFYGEGPAGQRGVYFGKTVVADTHTPIPGAPAGTTFGAFDDVQYSYYFNAGFRGGAQQPDGFYRQSFTGLTAVADSHTEIGFGSGKTLGPIHGSSAGSGTNITATAVLADPGAGVYWIDYYGVASPLALPGQPRPDGHGVLGPITNVASADGTIEAGPVVAFRSADAEGDAIYFNAIYDFYDFPKGVNHLVGAGDLIDGKSIADVWMTNAAMDSTTITFRADFVDGSSGIYTAVAYLPEPQVLSCAGLVLAWSARRTRR
jgi:hypothetical protein